MWYYKNESTTCANDDNEDDNENADDDNLPDVTSENGQVSHDDELNLNMNEIILEDHERTILMKQLKNFLYSLIIKVLICFSFCKKN